MSKFLATYKEVRRHLVDKWVIWFSRIACFLSTFGRASVMLDLCGMRRMYVSMMLISSSLPTVRNVTKACVCPRASNRQPCGIVANICQDYFRLRSSN